MTALFSIKDLAVEFATAEGAVQAVRGVDLAVDAGQTLAIVGESGCGKSVSLQAALGLLGPRARILRGSAQLDGQELIGLSTRARNQVLGSRLGMIFQNPMTALNPSMRIGQQIAETLLVHRKMSAAQAQHRAIELLARTGIPDAALRARHYPFEFSGGMLQRVMIAMSVACHPQVLIADEPTTALDVSIQAQILDLLQDMQRELGMAIILITHDLGVVARMADRVAVMYAGQVVEAGSCHDIFERPAHPYTVGLRQALPDPSAPPGQALRAIAGSPPELSRPLPGCAYFARCPCAMRLCRHQPPEAHEVGEQHRARCWLQHPLAPSRPDLHQLHPQTTRKMPIEPTI